MFPGVSEAPEASTQRRRWDRDPPEKLLSLLEKAQLSRAFSTFLINTGGRCMSEYTLLCECVNSASNI